MPNDAQAPITLPCTDNQLVDNLDDLMGLSIRSLLVDKEGNVYRLMMPRKFGDNPYLTCLTKLGVTHNVAISDFVDIAPLLIVWTPDALFQIIPSPIVTHPHGYVGIVRVGKIRPPCEVCHRDYFDSIHNGNRNIGHTHTTSPAPSTPSE